jgi:hypothetical protein
VGEEKIPGSEKLPEGINEHAREKMNVKAKILKRFILLLIFIGFPLLKKQKSDWLVANPQVLDIVLNSTSNKFDQHFRPG